MLLLEGVEEDVSSRAPYLNIRQIDILHTQIGHAHTLSEGPQRIFFHQQTYDARTNTRTHTHSRTLHARTLTPHTDKCTHHTHTHTHTHTNTHTLTLSLSLSHTHTHDTHTDTDTVKQTTRRTRTDT